MADRVRVRAVLLRIVRLRILAAVRVPDIARRVRRITRHHGQLTTRHHGQRTTRHVRLTACRRDQRLARRVKVRLLLERRVVADRMPPAVDRMVAALRIAAAADTVPAAVVGTRIARKW